MKKSFLQDVLDQPDALREAIDHYPHSHIAAIMEKMDAGAINRIVLAGHGSSYNSLYPAFLQLSSCSVPVTLWQTAELVHYGINQIDASTLLLVNSQSGSSIEVVRLVEKIADCRPACLLALTNDRISPLGASADVILEMHAGDEHGVATKTYINSLCLASLFAAQMCGLDVAETKKVMWQASDLMKEYLQNWEQKTTEISGLFKHMESIVVVGRGPSMATALNSALNQKEAAWLFTEGMNAAEFRHGPLELADSKTTLIIFEGDPLTSRFNKDLALEAQQYGSEVVWVGNQPPENIHALSIPEIGDIARPLVELVPLQLLAYSFANRKNHEPGKFRHIGKVVVKE